MILKPVHQRDNRGDDQNTSRENPAVITDLVIRTTPRTVAIRSENHNIILVSKVSIVDTRKSQ